MFARSSPEGDSIDAKTQKSVESASTALLTTPGKASLGSCGPIMQWPGKTPIRTFRRVIKRIV
jgi:hypothetical protein